MTGDLDAAGMEFKQSLQFNPGDAWTWQMYAEYLLATGRNGPMQNAMETARALDAASVSVTNDPALIAYVASQYEAAESNARINASLNSQDLFAQHILTLSLLGAGKYSDAAKQAVLEMQALKATPADLASVQGSKPRLPGELFHLVCAACGCQPLRQAHGRLPGGCLHASGQAG